MCKDAKTCRITPISPLKSIKTILVRGQHR
uniref:Uncharacterized protein n=1 Tax=Arundo donax TaxID=35708 RepID=A0A0A9B4Z8_ARUDO